jgi:hypothetical protein
MAGVATVENFVQTPRLILIARAGLRNVFREVAFEADGLPLHRADATHLEHQPLNDDAAFLHIRGHMLTRLLGKINQNGAGLERFDGAVKWDSLSVAALLARLGCGTIPARPRTLGAFTLWHPQRVTSVGCADSLNKTALFRGASRAKRKDHRALCLDTIVVTKSRHH